MANTLYTYHFSAEGEQLETIIALFEEDAEGFEEKDHSLIAYSFQEELPVEVLQFCKANSIHHTQETVEKTDWNKAWEDGFSPVHIDHRLCIRAPHHPNSDSDIDIVLMPKMAFGTGHHATTYLMAKAMLSMPLQAKKVLDFGTGTGVLAILAAKMQAQLVDAIDIDHQSIENAQHNWQQNALSTPFSLQEGDIEKAIGKYHVILANVTRNVILERLSQLSNMMLPGAQLLTSGFFNTDVPQIESEAKKAGLKLQSQQERDSWVQVTFEKVND